MEFFEKVSVSSIINGKEIEHCAVPVLKYNATYPCFSSRAFRTAAEMINRRYCTIAQTFIRQSEGPLLAEAVDGYRNSIENNYPVHEYEADLAYTLTYNCNCLLSLYLQQYEYTGGAHGNTVQSSDTWDLRHCERLRLCRFFSKNINYERLIKTEVIRQIKAQITNGSGAYFDNYAELVEQTFNPCSFYLTPDGIAVYFQQYDIAPYSSGIPTFIIPFDKACLRNIGC